jgi:hypothetical protein
VRGREVLRLDVVLDVATEVRGEPSKSCKFHCLPLSQTPWFCSALASYYRRQEPTPADGVRKPSHRNVRFAGGYMLILRLEECGRGEVLLRVRSAPRLGFPSD